MLQLKLAVQGRRKRRRPRKCQAAFRPELPCCSTAARSGGSGAVAQSQSHAAPTLAWGPLWWCSAAGKPEGAAQGPGGAGYLARRARWQPGSPSGVAASGLHSAPLRHRCGSAVDVVHRQSDQDFWRLPHSPACVAAPRPTVAASRRLGPADECWRWESGNHPGQSVSHRAPKWTQASRRRCGRERAQGMTTRGRVRADTWAEPAAARA